MIQSQNVYKFFITAQTPSGFKSYIDELANPSVYNKLYVIKGCAGSGKSTFIKKATSVLRNDNSVTELIYCPSDVTSLDAAIFKEQKIAFADATNPHILEPGFLGFFERVVSLYDYYDNLKLVEIKDEIEKVSKIEEMHQKRSENFIKAAGFLLSSNQSIASRCILNDKLVNFITRLCIREIKKTDNKDPLLHKRYLSTITGDGIFMFSDTIEKICDKLYVIEDEYGAVSGMVLKAVEKMALSMGYEVYSCICPLSLSEKIEHLFVPKLNLGFTTSNKFHPYKNAYYKKIRTDRFLDKEMLSRYSYRVGFQRKAARELLLEAAEFKKLWLQEHKELERLYLSACDFEKREKYMDEILTELK